MGLLVPAYKLRKLTDKESEDGRELRVWDWAAVKCWGPFFKQCDQRKERREKQKQEGVGHVGNAFRIPGLRTWFQILDFK